jgi:uncharacterized membrane protein
MKASYLKVRLLLGCVSLVIGLLAANLALFGWRNPHGFFYLLGEYAHYACAYGGFAAIIFGAMLVNDFFVFRKFVLRKLTDIKPEAGSSKVDSDYRRILAWIAEEYAENLRKSSSKEAEPTRSDFFVEKEEERKVVAQ